MGESDKTALFYSYIKNNAHLNSKTFIITKKFKT